MSAQKPATPPGGPGRGPGGPGPGGPGGHALVMPTAKPKDFKGALLRLGGLLRTERLRIAVVLVLAVISVTFMIVGPKILGNATDILFDGVVSKQLPAGSTQAQAVAALRAKGQDTQADMLSSMTIHPGQGVDFAALGRTLLLLVAVYLLSAAFAWLQQYIMAGVAQRTVYRLRRQADEKLARLPLRYFDDHPRGDVLSRVTNDIDNISQSLQQSLTQLITALLTIVGVLIMMLSISWILALISLLAVPLSVLLTVIIAKRSQKQFAAQWERTGELNGHVEEMFTGHNVVKVFGRQKQAIATFDEQNERLYEASFRAQFISGMIMPVMTFVTNLNYVAIAVVGGLLVANGRISLGDVQAFIQYSRHVHHADHADGQHHERPAEHGGVGRAGLRAARRGRGRARHRRRRSCSVTRAATSPSRTCPSATCPDTPLIEDLDLDVRPARPSPSSGPPAPARRRWSTCCCASTRSTTGASSSTAWTRGR